MRSSVRLILYQIRTIDANKLPIFNYFKCFDINKVRLITSK